MANSTHLQNHAKVEQRIDELEAAQQTIVQALESRVKTLTSSLEQSRTETDVYSKELRKTIERADLLQVKLDLESGAHSLTIEKLDRLEAENAVFVSQLEQKERMVDEHLKNEIRLQAEVEQLKADYFKATQRKLGE